VAYFKVLSRHMPARTAQNHKKFTQNNMFTGRDLNPEPIVHDAGVVIIEPQLSV
jgi:hypothetical protein